MLFVGPLASKYTLEAKLAFYVFSRLGIYIEPWKKVRDIYLPSCHFLTTFKINNTFSGLVNT